MKLLAALPLVVNSQDLFLESRSAQTWAGTLDFHPYASNVPLNITVDANNIATFEWTYDHDGAGNVCADHPETDIHWVVDGTKLTAHGTGQDPAYYGFEGVIDGDTITGDLLNANQKDKVGTWTAKRNAPMAPPQCSPPPAPPPGPTGLPEIWPVPKQYTSGSTKLTVAPSSDFFIAKGQVPPLVESAFARYSDLCFAHHVAPADGTVLSGIEVSVESQDESHMQIDSDESYTLSIPEDGGKATLSAKTVWGVLRGLETFSQMLVFDFESDSYTLPGAPWSIDDAPRFAHRGLMIDTSRHFETLAGIRSIIDSLPYAKINVLHWHMSDSQSFPMELKSRPKLWDGAYSEQERYLQADIEDIVEYARLRGVRVMVEFDVPGHAGSWCTGYPEVCPSASCTQPLNVANNETFAVIEDILKECTGGVSPDSGSNPGLFKDKFIHLGGDEVNTDCWTKTDSVASWLSDQGMTADQGYAYFVKKVAGMAIDQGHRPVQWSEVYDHFKTDLPKETIVHIWKGVTNVTEVVANGYQVLLNVGYNAKSWYLDNLQVKWDAVYSNEPCDGVPDDLCPLILGGHGEMWGETVDMSDLEQTVWPRMAAIAERLWSPREYTDTNDALNRIESFRCLLNRRGIKSAPVTNANARSAPSGPGSCFSQ
jgi:hexosaminidase